MSTDSDNPDFACRCLNICLFQRTDQKASQKPLESASDYQLLYVGEDGIIIKHNELTLRHRSAISTVNGTSGTRHTQDTLVTCLVCDTAAYRVKADTPLDADAKEGPILPTEDWVERDTLMSASGWVEVHVGENGCIRKEEARQIASSSSYSKQYLIMLPEDSHILSTSPTSTLPRTKIFVPASHTFLPSLPPFLPHPPFTPSHPVFLHLASIATASSNAARSAVESRIEEFAKQQLHQLEEDETQLKVQLESLWRNVREALKKAERERDAELFPMLRSRRRSISPGSRSSSMLREIGSPVVRDFNPSSYHVPRTSSSSVARQSALSASLATTTFYHPRGREDDKNGRSVAAESSSKQRLTPSPPPYASNPSSAGSSSSPSSSTAINVPRSLKRNMDAVNDTAVSYKYELEEQEKERRSARLKASKETRKKGKKGDLQVGSRPAEEETSGPAQAKQVAPAVEEKNDKAGSQGQDSPMKREGKKDSRRKVTFDVEPDVVTIERDIISEKDEGLVTENGEELMFDFEGDHAEDRPRKKKINDDVDGEPPKPVLPLYETPEQSQRLTRRPNDLKNEGLPQSFASLRPSSLPAPSHIRPPLRLRSDERQSRPVSSSAAPSSKSNKELKNSKRPAQSEDLLKDTLHPYQKELLKYVAADTPSHRGAWSRNSNAWKIFDRSSSPGTNSPTILEEEEDGELLREASDPGSNGFKEKDSDWRKYLPADFAGSLPVPMAPISQFKANGVPSLQPKTSLSDRQGVLVPPLPPLAEEGEGRKKKSAAASRREVYAERDRARAMDPGILDFERGDGDRDDDDDDDEEEEETSDPTNPVSMSSGRRHALKIIKARNSVPAEGLWRSLAT